MKAHFKDEIVNYKGKGFLGFKEGNRLMKFIKYSGVRDAYCEYLSDSSGCIEVLVSIYEIK